MSKILENKCKEELKNVDFNHKKLLLHSCCAPCSSHVITYLSKYFDITILYYNPNIAPEEEYLKRKNEQIKLLEVQNDCLKEQLKRAIENEKVAKKEAKYNRIWAFISTFIAFASLIATIVIAIVK